MKSLIPIYVLEVKKLMVYLAALIVVVLILSFRMMPGEADVEADSLVEKVIDKPDLHLRGKQLFKSNCASCHNKNMKDDMTGPALAGISDRWEDTTDLYRWIRNSQSYLTETDDPYARNLFVEWDKRIMSPFTNLSDEDIGEILAYIDHKAAR